MLSDRCLSVCPVCLSVTFVHCGQTVGRIKVKLGTQVGLGPGHILLDGDPPLPPKKGHSPQFSAHICCDQMVAWIKISLGMEVGLGSGDFALDGDPAPLPQRDTPPKFSAHICCDQMAALIKMPLSVEIGLGPGDIVLDGDPAPTSHKKGRSPLFNFRPSSIVAKRLDAARCHLLWR